jgi:hypothetical protein
LYWLNFNLLEKRNGVLFQKHILFGNFVITLIV